jgi:hypothetical protein
VQYGVEIKRPFCAVQIRDTPSRVTSNKPRITAQFDSLIDFRISCFDSCRSLFSKFYELLFPPAAGASLGGQTLCFHIIQTPGAVAYLQGFLWSVKCQQ